MSRANVPQPAAPIIEKRGFGFCYSSDEPLLEVRADASCGDLFKEVYTLMQTIEEVLGKAIATGASGDSDGVLDVSTAYILRFAADAAAAMVGSLECKR